MYEDDDPDNNRIPQQNSQSPQSSPDIQLVLSGIQYQHFNDSHISQYHSTNKTNSSTSTFDDSPCTIETPDSNVITKTPIKTTFTQYFSISYLTSTPQKIYTSSFWHIISFNSI